MTDPQAVQRQAEATARAAVERVLAEYGCLRTDLAGPRIHQIYVGHFELRARRLGPEYCPNHPRTRMPCGLCPPIDRTDHDDPEDTPWPALDQETWRRGRQDEGPGGAG